MNDQELRNLYQRMIARRTVAGRDGCVTVEQLVELAEGRISAHRLPWTMHLASCPRCRDELRLLQAVAEAGEGAPGRRMSAFALALAATIALVLGGTILWRSRLDRQPDIMRGASTTVSLVSPAGDIPIARARVLEWHALPRAAGYEVEVLEPTGTPIFVTSTTDTSVTVPAETTFATDKEYRWRVIARLNDGARPSSPAQAFRVHDK